MFNHLVILVVMFEFQMSEGRLWGGSCGEKVVEIDSHNSCY